ncbi:MAG: hypothetical protein ACP5MZ_02370 [Candidatus Micrarchaeia archaeon]
MAVAITNSKGEALKGLADVLSVERVDYANALDLFVMVPKRVLQMHKCNFDSTIDTYEKQLAYLLPKRPSTEMLAIVSKYANSIKGIVKGNLDRMWLPDNTADLPRVYEAYKRFTSLVYDDLCKKTDELITDLQRPVMLRQDR